VSFIPARGLVFSVIWCARDVKIAVSFSAAVLLCCCAARTGHGVGDGCGDGAVPFRDELVADRFFGWEVVVQSTFGKFSNLGDGVDTGVAVSVGVELPGCDGDDRFSCSHCAGGLGRRRVASRWGYF